jgi:hypothetical protein
MANLHSRRLYGNQLFYDTYRHRIVDAIGPGVTKFILNTAYMPVDDTTGDLTGFTHTAVEGAGTSTAVLADNTLLISTGTNEDDSVNLQVKGEAFKLDATTKYVYFGINFQVLDADACDVITGLVITDSEIQGGATDGVYFESYDASTAIALVLEKNNTETTSDALSVALADTTNITLEFVFDGTYIDSWVNGTLQTRQAVTNLPNDEFLTPTIEYESGSAGAKTMTVNWWRVIQIDGTK